MEVYKKYAIDEYTVLKSDNWVHNLLPKVKVNSTDEEYSYKYWKKYLEEKSGRLSSHFFRLVAADNSFDNSVDILLEIIKNKPLSFVNCDICGEIEVTKKYDIVIISNILEWNLYNSESIKKCKQNLERLLKDDGKAICSCYMDSDANKQEREIFQDSFEYERFFWDENVKSENSPVIGYSYQKKRC